MTTKRINGRSTVWTGWIGNDVAPRRLTQSIALEESPVPGLLRTAVTVLSGLMALFIGWSAFASVEEVASAPGQIVPSGYIQDIQHLDGGVVREILVREGDMVERGQALLKLDATSADADLGQMKARQTALQLQVARLRQFAEGKGDAKGLSGDEKAILASMVEARRRQQDVLRDQLAGKQKELQANMANRDALQKNVALMQQEYQISQQMAAKGSGSKIDAMSAERQLNALQGQYNQAVNQVNQSHDAVSEMASRLQSLDADLNQEAMKNLGTAQAQLDEVDKQITKLQSAASRAVIAAPVRGIVKGLAVHTIGAVVEPGKVLMEIVPVNEELEVEALVSPSDIGNLKTGEPVKVKVSAFDASRYGSVPGTLQSISASTFQNEQGMTFYRARIRLARNYVGNDPSRNLILPGMTVQTEIITGDKTVLAYMLKPLNTAAQGALHER